MSIFHSKLAAQNVSPKFIEAVARQVVANREKQQQHTRLQQHQRAIVRKPPPQHFDVEKLLRKPGGTR